jgi:hypothetical protein
MGKWAQGFYTPKNPQKYIGKHNPKYRSGWELTFMTFCDTHNNVLYWASEALRIPYKHPFTGKPTIYVPDFFVVYENKFGKKVAEVVEIKPKKQSIIESKVASAKDRMIVAINHAKWQAAMGYCKSQGYTFRVVTENDLFRNGSQT